MSTVALSRSPSRTVSLVKGTLALGYPVWHRLLRRVKAGRDERVLQTLPDHVLADIGLSKVEIMQGSHGGRQVWVIPHRS